MSDAITTFFDTWKMTDADERLQQIESVVSSEISYSDPRSPQTITGASALSEYVGMFSAHAPGWSAEVINTDTTAGMVRATVAFGGPGPDGNDMVQHGQYFVETENDLITRMVGFVGTGDPS